MININKYCVNPPNFELTEKNKEKINKYISKEISRLCICGTYLEKCKGVEPFSEDYLICPLCDSTYQIR